MTFDKDEISLMTKIAHLYYEEGKTQEEIGEIFGISRFKVLRLLQEAREIGVVTIKINDLTSTCSDLEEGLEKSFGLKKALVVPIRPLPRFFVTQEIGKWGARLLVDTIQDKDIVGVGWGATISECAKQLEDTYKDVTLVPLGGGTGQIKSIYQVNEICREMASKFKAKWYSLDIPIFLENKETKEILFKEPRIKEIIDLWDELTVVIIGIGNLTGLWEDRSPILAFSKKATEILREELTLYRSVGDIVQNFFDIDGNISPISIRDHIISIPIEKFKRVRDVIALSGWRGKKEAILGALRTGYITHLVTDEIVAEYLLKEASLKERRLG